MQPIRMYCAGLCTLFRAVRMSSKRIIQVIDMLFSKACSDLQEGRFANSICYLFFSDGYSPLLIDRPANQYLEFAGGVISNLMPETYVYMCVNHGINNDSAVVDNYISALVVNKNGTSWILKRPYSTVGEAIIFMGDPIQPNSLDMDITGRAADLYRRLSMPQESEIKMKAIVSKVSSFLQVSKIPYSKVIKKKEH